MRREEMTGQGGSLRDARGQSVWSRAAARANAAGKEGEALGEQKASVGVHGTRS